MNFLALIPLLAQANVPVSSNEIKNNEIDLVYTFSKVSINGYANPIDVAVYDISGFTIDDKTKKLTFGWGNQACFVYDRLLNNSTYAFHSAFTFLHAGNTFFTSVPSDSSISISGSSLNFIRGPASFYERDQINYYQADLFMKKELAHSKHVVFNVWGGLITSWY
jgi:hypothetical protein